MLSDIIQYLIPSAKFALNGEPADATEYAENLIWSDDRPKPTWAELQAAKPAHEQAITVEAIKQARADAYRAEADPLYFGWQRGEHTEQEWLDKVAEIRARYPYPA